MREWFIAYKGDVAVILGTAGGIFALIGHYRVGIILLTLGLLIKSVFSRRGR